METTSLEEKITDRSSNKDRGEREYPKEEKEGFRSGPRVPGGRSCRKKEKQKTTLRQI